MNNFTEFFKSILKEANISLTQELTIENIRFAIRN